MLTEINAAAKEVRTVQDLSLCDRLIIPGGESTTLNILLKLAGLGEAIQDRAREGMPIWGTCMGMILMASQIEDREQGSLGLLDITVRRNAFGAQVHSFEAKGEMTGFEAPVSGVFIRSPIVTRCGTNVEAIGEFEDKTVAVRADNLLGTSFHPELTDDVRLHSWFLSF